VGRHFGVIRGVIDGGVTSRARPAEYWRALNLGTRRTTMEKHNVMLLKRGIR